MSRTSLSWIVLALSLGALAGCSGATTSDDAATTNDAASSFDGAPGPDAARTNDAATTNDAFVTNDAATTNDAFVTNDAATTNDAFVANDAGSDAFVAVDVGTDAPSQSDAGATPCTSCSAGMTCGYLIADGCSAVGQCVTIPAGSPCGAITLITGCGCDGTDVTWHGGCHPSLPDGYAPAPITHMGGCS